jgi:ribokinase
MARFLVVASVNADRIWRLDEKLRPGGRHFAGDVALQIGGAGWFSASALRAAGHEVTLACVLGEDATGAALRRRLDGIGVDLAFARRMPRTEPCDILVDPDGERTLIFTRSPESRVPPTPPQGGNFDGAYVNTASAVDILGAVRAGAPNLLQMPLRDRIGRYPATHAVVSRSDVRDPAPALWTRAVEVTSGLAQGLIVTNGPDLLLVITAAVQTAIAAGPSAPEGRITIGAGDTFAGHLLAGLAGGSAPADAAAAAAQAASRWLADRPEPRALEP